MQPDLRAALIALFVLLFLGSVRSDEKNGKWWHDNLGGPDSSNYVDLDQIKRSNVDEMEVAWTYPYAAGGFNPIVVDDTVYVSGRNGSLIALDASTGKEIWIHEGLNGMPGRHAITSAFAGSSSRIDANCALVKRASVRATWAATRSSSAVSGSSG